MLTHQSVSIESVRHVELQPLMMVIFPDFVVERFIALGLLLTYVGGHNAINRSTTKSGRYLERGRGTGLPNSLATLRQLSIASNPCLTAFLYVLPCVIHPGSSGTLTT